VEQRARARGVDEHGGFTGEDAAAARRERGARRTRERGVEQRVAGGLLERREATRSASPAHRLRACAATHARARARARRLARHA
jgi:hypothetical protein